MAQSKPSGKLWRALAGLTVIGLLLTVTVTVAGAAQQNEIILSIDFDGKQPNGDTPYASNTDGQHTAGDDENDANNVVRTHDQIGYRIDWTVNEIDGTGVTLTATLPEGMYWIEDVTTSTGVPAGCLDGTSSITGNDGRDLVCDTGAESEGSNGVIHPVAYVGSQFDGTALSLTADITTGEAAPVTSNQVTTYASARPRADWIKGDDILAFDPPVVVGQEPSNEYYDIAHPETGEIGRIWIYPLRLVPSGGLLGSERMDDTKPIEFYDHAYQMPAGAELATDMVPATPTGAPRTACGAYDGLGDYPVDTAGTWTCTLDTTATTANGYPVVHVEITGQDTFTMPPLNGNGSSNDDHFLAGQIAFWVPEASMSSFPVDVYNGLSSTTDEVSEPADLDPVQVWGSAPTSFDEAGVDNNYAYWRATAVPTASSPGRAFRHMVKYQDGPYREYSRQLPNGFDYRSYDSRREIYGGSGIMVTTNTGDNTLDPGWGIGRNGPSAALTPRGNELVLVAELDHRQTAPDEVFYREPSSLCVAIDPTHQELVPLPSAFEVSVLEQQAPGAPWVFGNIATASATTGSPNSGPLAHVHIGTHANYPQRVFSYTHGVETTEVDIDYVVEFGAGKATPSNMSTINGVTCNNADVDDRGWVDSTGVLNVFDQNGDGRYEDITHVRLRVLEPMNWLGSELNPRFYNADSAADHGTAINLNLQVRVKDDPVANQANQELFAYASRAYTPLDDDGNIVVWDPETMDNPGTDTCTNTTGSVFQNRFGDDVDYNVDPENGWCNLPYSDDGGNSTDLGDNPLDFGGGGQDAYELCSNASYMAGGCYPRSVHADKVTIIEAELSVGKANLAGPTDYNQNGDQIEFELRPSIVGADVDTLSDVVMTDTLDARYEFVEFTLLPTTSTNSNATTPPNNDGTSLTGNGVLDPGEDTDGDGVLDPGEDSPCEISGQTITCDFGTQVGGWSDKVRYTVVQRDALANQTINNTVYLDGKDALSGFDKDQKSAKVSTYTPGPFEESSIVKAVDAHIGPCGVHPTEDPVPAGWGDRCSVIAPNSHMVFDLQVTNEGLTDLDDYRLIDVIPHRADGSEPASATLTGDGRSPESTYAGSLEFVSVTGAGATFLYSMDPASSISRDPEVSEAVNTWCDSDTGGTAVFGTGSCPGGPADVSAIYADMGTLEIAEVRNHVMTLKSTDNECDDVYTNTFGARTPDIFLPVRSNDVSVMVAFCEPSIAIEKDTNGFDADNEPAAPAGSNIGPAIVVGEDVTWTYVVTNDGDVPVIDATVTDTPAQAITCDVDGDGTFESGPVIPVFLPGDEVTCQATGSATLGQYQNNVEVAGTPMTPDFDGCACDPADPATWPTDPSGYVVPTDPATGDPALPVEVADGDPSHYFGVPVPDPVIDVEKDTNGVQADSTAGPVIPVGDEVIWTYVVANPGTVTIAPATITDDRGVTVDCDIDGDGTFDGTNVIPMLVPSGSVTCEGTGTAYPGPYENTATVSGPAALPVVDCVCDPTDATSWPTDPAAYETYVDPITGLDVTAEDVDPSHYVGVEPGVDIEKATNGAQSDTAPGERLAPGDPVTWTYVVTNAGSTALADAEVTDSEGLAVDCDTDGDGSLDDTNVVPLLLPGAAVTCEATGTAIEGPYANTGTVSGAPVMPDFESCGCDPADVSTWPTAADDFTAVLDPSGVPVGQVSDNDESNYVGIESGNNSLGDYVWFDADNDGVQDPDEVPAEGVTVNLYGADGNLIGTTTTDADGFYDFAVLPDGRYQVEFVPLIGYGFTQTRQGDDDTDSDADSSGLSPVTDLDSDGELDDGVRVSTVDAGLIHPQGIGGIVWFDTDGDGVQDPGEQVVGGVLVELLDAAGNPVLGLDGKPITAITGPDGSYYFPVPPGDYRLKFSPGEDSTFSDGTGADNDLTDLLNGMSGVYSVVAGVSITGVDAPLTEVESATPALLAFTGASTRTVIGVGLVLIGLGGAVLLAGPGRVFRRRES